MKLVWFTPKWPLPAEDGARKATTQLISHLSRLGAEIHLVSYHDGALPDTNTAIKELGLSSAQTVLKTKTGLFNRLLDFISQPLTPMTITPYASHQTSEQIKTILKSFQKNSIIVFDGLHTAGWTKHYAAPFSTFYRAHNVEKNIWSRNAKETKNIIKKIFLTLQAYLMDRFERKISNLSTYIFPVSDADRDVFKKMIKHSNVLTLPIGMSAPDILPSKSNTLLYVGKMDWPPNRDGLKWFLEKVWPTVRKNRQDLSLKIVGSGDSTWIEPYKKMDGITFLGRVSELAPYYEESVATLVPIFYGSGTRVKAIESCLHQRACISTECGIEGIGLTKNKHYINAETAQDWINALMQLDFNQTSRMGRDAFDFTSKKFNPAQIAKSFITTIQGSTA